MNFLLRIPDETHAYISEKAKSKDMSMNEFINHILESEMASQSNYSTQLEMKRLINDLRNILENQIKVIDENNKWNEIQTNMLYEILGVDRDD